MKKILFLILSVYCSLTRRFSDVFQSHIKGNKFIRCTTFYPPRNYLKVEIEYGGLKIYKFTGSDSDEVLLNTVKFPEHIFGSKYSFLSFFCEEIKEYSKNYENVLIIDKTDFYKVEKEKKDNKEEKKDKISFKSILKKKSDSSEDPKKIKKSLNQSKSSLNDKHLNASLEKIKDEVSSEKLIDSSSKPAKESILKNRSSMEMAYQKVIEEYKDVSKGAIPKVKTSVIPPEPAKRTSLIKSTSNEDVYQVVLENETKKQVQVDYYNVPPQKPPRSRIPSENVYLEIVEEPELATKDEKLKDKKTEEPKKVKRRNSFSESSSPGIVFHKKVHEVSNFEVDEAVVTKNLKPHKEKYIFTNKLERMFDNIKKEIEEYLTAEFFHSVYKFKNFCYLDYRQYKYIQKQNKNIVYVYNHHNKAKILISLKNEENSYVTSILVSDILSPEIIEDVQSKTLNKKINSKIMKKIDNYFNFNIFGYNLVENIISRNVFIIPYINWMITQCQLLKEKKTSFDPIERFLDFFFLNMIHSRKLVELNIVFLNASNCSERYNHLQSLYALKVIDQTLINEFKENENSEKIFDRSRYNFSVLCEISNVIINREDPRLAVKDKDNIEARYKDFKNVRDNMLNSFSKITNECNILDIYNDKDVVKDIFDLLLPLKGLVLSILNEAYMKILNSVADVIKIRDAGLKIKYEFFIPTQENKKLDLNIRLDKYAKTSSLVHKIDSGRFNLPFIIINE